MSNLEEKTDCLVCADNKKNRRVLYQKNYNEKHRLSINLKRRHYYWLNKEKINKRQKKYRINKRNYLNNKKYKYNKDYKYKLKLIEFNNYIEIENPLTIG